MWKRFFYFVDYSQPCQSRGLGLQGFKFSSCVPLLDYFYFYSPPSFSPIQSRGYHFECRRLVYHLCEDKIYHHIWRLWPVEETSLNYSTQQMLNISKAMFLLLWSQHSLHVRTTCWCSLHMYVMSFSLRCLCFSGEQGWDPLLILQLEDFMKQEEEL